MVGESGTPMTELARQCSTITPLLCLCAFRDFPTEQWQTKALEGGREGEGEDEYLWLFGRCLVHFAEEVFQLWPVTHELVVHSVRLVQEAVDVGYGLQIKTWNLCYNF